MGNKLYRTATLHTSVDDVLQGVDRLISSGEEVYATKHLGNTTLSKFVKAGESEWGIPSYKREPQKTYFVDGAKNKAWKTRVKVFLRNHFNDNTASEYLHDEGTYSMWKTDYPKDVEKIIELLKSLKTQLQNKEVFIEMQNTNNSFNANAVSSSITRLQEFISQAKVIRQEECQTPGRGLAMPDFISGPKYDKWMNSIKIFADRNLKDHELYENIIKTYETRNSLSLSKLDNMLGYLETICNDDEFLNSTMPKNGGDTMNVMNQPIIFISHKSDDQKYGHALAELIRGLGVSNSQLIYTSHPLHKIPLNHNIYSYLRSRLGENTFMIYLLSDTYFESSPCLNEMGAAWMAQSDYTNIFVPGFDFHNRKFLECAIDNKKIGVVLNGDQQCKVNMIELRNKIQSLLNLQIDEAQWMILLDKFITDISPSKEVTIIDGGTF